MYYLLRLAYSSMPVWTALTTSDIRYRGWARLVEPGLIVIRNPRQIIFVSNSDYTPPQTSRGEYILKFTSHDGRSMLLERRTITNLKSSTDAQAFLETILYLGEVAYASSKIPQKDQNSTWSF